MEHSRSVQSLAPELANEGLLSTDDILAGHKIEHAVIIMIIIENHKQRYPVFRVQPVVVFQEPLATIFFPSASNRLDVGHEFAEPTPLVA